MKPKIIFSKLWKYEKGIESFFFLIQKYFCLRLLGYLLASYSNGNYYIILGGIGIVTGAGIGFGYVCPLTTCIKWFPKKKGLITGLAVAGFGGGAIVLTQFVSFFQNNGLERLLIFRYIAIFTGIPAIAVTLILTNPPDFNPKEVKDQKVTHFLKNKVIIAMIIGMFSGTFGGLMVVSNIKQIGLANQLTEYYAVLAISLFAVGNALGRVLWGTIFDKVGKKAIPISLIVLGFSAVLMLSGSSFIFNLGSIISLCILSLWNICYIRAVIRWLDL